MMLVVLAVMLVMVLLPLFAHLFGMFAHLLVAMFHIVLVVVIVVFKVVIVVIVDWHSGSRSGNGDASGQRHAQSGHRGTMPHGFPVCLVCSGRWSVHVSYARHQWYAHFRFRFVVEIMHAMMVMRWRDYHRREERLVCHVEIHPVRSRA